MSAQTRANVHLARKNKLRGLPFFDDLPEVRCHRAIVISKFLIKGPLGLVRRPPGGLFALGGFGLVLLHFDLKISHHGTTPATRTTFDSTVACAEKMATPRKFRSRDSLDHVAHRMRPPPLVVVLFQRRGGALMRSI